MILLMQFFNDLPGMIEVRRMESQTVPMGFISPIFPVLHNVIQRNPPFTILLYNGFQLIERFIAFFRLPETIYPLPEHRHVSRQFPITGNDFVHILAIYKIIVGSIAYLGSKWVSFFRIFKLCWRIIIPQDTISVSRDKERIDNIHISL